MESKKILLNKNVINVEEQEKQMTPQDFQNLPINNKLEIDSQTLMMVLKSKNSWDDPDEFNLTSPEICAGLAQVWSTEYLIFNNLL